MTSTDVPNPAFDYTYMIQEFVLDVNLVLIVLSFHV